VANGGQFQIQASSVTKWQLYRDGGSGDLRIYDTAAGLDRLQISTAGAVTIPGTLSVTGAVSGGAATFTTGAFALAQDTTTIVSNSNSDAVGTSAQVRFSALASTANALLVANGAGRVATRYGVTLANAAELLTTTGSSLLIGSTANVPIVFGVAGAEVGRFALTGLSVTGTLGVTGNITVGAGNKFTTDAGNDLNLDAPSSRSLFLKIGGSTKVTVDNAGAVTIPGTLGVGSANAVAYGREQIFGTIAKATTTDEVTLFTGSSDATGALGLRITNKNHATAGSRAVFLEAAEPGVAIRTLQLNNSGYTIDSSGNTVIPGTLGVTGNVTINSTGQAEFIPNAATGNAARVTFKINGTRTAAWSSDAASELKLLNAAGSAVANFTSTGLSVTGNISVTGESSNITALTAGTTQKFLEFQSTGNAGFYFGIESSSAGGFFTGSAAYESVIYSTGNPVFFNTSAVRMNGTLGVTGNVYTSQAYTASLGNGVSADLVTTGNYSFYIVTAAGDTNSTQYATATVYTEGGGTVRILGQTNSGISITSSGANKISITNGTTTQAIRWSALKVQQL